jgi:predicted ATP-dependent serine protease
MPNADDPRLSVRITIIQAINSNPGSIGQFKGSGFDVVRVALRQQIATIFP